MKTSVLLPRWAVMTGITLVCLLTLLFATPQGKALAQNILNFFYRSQDNQQPVMVVEAGLQDQTKEQTGPLQLEESSEITLSAECGPLLSPGCALKQAQEMAGFNLLLPDNHPEGMAFSGAATLPNGALVKYEGQYGVLLLAESLPDDQAAQTWKIGQDAEVVSVTVRGQPAEYVQGGWTGLGISDENMNWDENLPTRTLRWQMDGVEYTLVNFPAQSASGPIGLELAALQLLAEGITGGVQASVQASSGISLAEAEAQAGFAFPEPGWTPAGFAARKTTYDSQHNAICQYYFTNADVPQTSPLVIGKSGWAFPAVEELQTNATYDGEEVNIAAFQQVLEIPGAAGGTGLFLETGLQVDAFCGGSPTTANRALLWQKGTHTYALFAPLDANDGRGFVTMQEMQRLAESLNGSHATADATAAPDPERLLSVKDVEEFNGLKILQPAFMLSNVYFDHITTRSQQRETGAIVTYYAGQPVGDGRTYHMKVIQTPDSDQTLANLALAGGYEDASVNGKPAIYQASCWDSTNLLYGNECRQFLTWFDGNTQYDLEAYFPGMVPRETFFAIAESMR